MASAVYALCAITSLACATLLLRAYGRQRTKLLFWSSVCFVGLALNNALLFVDLVVVPTRDLSLIRGLTGLGAIAALLYGLIWETR